MKALRAVGKFFGMTGEPPLGADGNGRVPGDPGYELQYLQPSLRREGALMGFAALAATLMVTVGFDWPLSELLGEIVVGTLAWSAAGYLLYTGAQVPHGALEPPPARAVVVESSGRFWRRVTWGVPLVLAMTWFASESDPEGFFIPGIFFGYAAAFLVAAASVSRWEQEHGRRVVIPAGGSGHGGLFAVGSEQSETRMQPVA